MVIIFDSYLETISDSGEEKYSVMLESGNESLMATGVPNWKTLEPYLKENQDALEKLFLSWKKYAMSDQPRFFLFEKKSEGWEESSF